MAYLPDPFDYQQQFEDQGLLMSKQVKNFTISLFITQIFKLPLNSKQLKSTFEMSRPQMSL